MTALSCADVEPLLDLYAADECEVSLRKQIHAHLSQCHSCRESLAEARHVVGLLDIHYRQPAALQRINKAIRREARPAIPAIPSLSRFGSLAAMLLVCLGLGLGLVPSSSATLPVALSVAESEGGTRLVPGKVEHAKMGHLDTAKTNQVGISLILPVHWQTHIQGKVPPLPPRVDLDFVVHNTGQEPMSVRVGSQPEVQVDLRGPSVLRRLAPEGASLPLAWRKTTIPPRGKTHFRYERLVSFHDGQMEYVYPVSPGYYRLLVRVRLLVSTPSSGERVLWLTAGNSVTLTAHASK